MEGLCLEPQLQKQIFISNATRDIKKGLILDKESVNKLIEKNSYDVLEYAFENNAISENSLELFKYPEKGAKHRKVRLKLYDLAQKYKV